MMREPVRYAPHVLAVSVGYVLFAYAALPGPLTTRLGIGLSAFGLLMSTPLGAFVVVQRLASRWLDRYGTTRVLLWAGLAHLAVGLPMDLSANYPVVLALRGVWGLAGGLVVTVGATHIARRSRGSSATRQQGVYGGLLTLGGTVGFLLAPTLVERVGWLGLHAPGALLAVPAIVICARHRGESAGAGGEESGTDGVLFHPVVLFAAAGYVSLVGTYITLSTFVTSYFADLGVIERLNVLVLATATVGRIGGGEAVWRSSLGDVRLVATSAVVATAGLGAMAATGHPLAVVVLPFVVMFAVSVPFGAVYNLAASATDRDGAALALMVAAGNVAALVLPPVAGAIREATGKYDGAFLVLAAVNATVAVAAVGVWRYTRRSRPPSRRR